MIVLHIGGGRRLLFYVKEDRNCKVLTNYPMRQDFEILALKLKISKTNRLIISTYKPPSLNVTFSSETKNIVKF